MTMTMTGSAGVAAPTASHRTPTSAAADTDGCYAVISLSGRLSVLEPAAGTAEGFPAGRRTATGTVYRIDLDAGITCWLDGDHQDGSGELNPAATHACTALSERPFSDPWDAPFVCGPVVFTGTEDGRPVGLTDAQLARIVEAYPADEDAVELFDEPDLMPELAVAWPI